MTDRFVIRMTHDYNKITDAAVLFIQKSMTL